MSSLNDFFSAVSSVSSFFSTPVYNDEPKGEEPQESASNDDASEEKSDDDAPAEAEEEEEEEPEDIAPALRDECAQSAACSGANKHFEHCVEKVNAGKGYAHEDCVEELFHLMHCVDACVAPKLFSKLR